LLRPGFTSRWTGRPRVTASLPNFSRDAVDRAVDPAILRGVGNGKRVE
jgi:hypothetical protein